MVKKIFIEYSFEQNGKSVIVTQDFNLKSGLIDAFFMFFLGTKKAMEKMNARDLELLKTVLKNNYFLY